MSTQRIRTIYTLSMVVLDFLLIALAFALAYRLRVSIDWPDPLTNQVPLANYLGLFLAQAVSIIAVLFLNRQYYVPRAVSRLDQIYYVFISVSVGILIGIALTTIALRNNQALLEYPRAMLVYNWLLTIALLMFGRFLGNWVRNGLQERGIGKDRVILVGTGDTARMILQRIVCHPAWATIWSASSTAMSAKPKSSASRFLDSRKTCPI
jgi:FlaA1/EpsC-like NDP-sugar epimerase